MFIRRTGRPRLDHLARAAGLEIDTPQVAEVSVACSSGVLGSLLSNLIGNAIKYSGPECDGNVEVRVTSLAAKARFEVEDHGPGLPPGLISKVFDPYVRGDEHHQPGLGLGLATVKRLSEGHGGACGVFSKEGRGCVFWFELPLTDSPDHSDRRVRRAAESEASLRT